MFAIALVFLLRPLKKDSVKFAVVDYILLIIALISCVYIIDQYSSLAMRAGVPLVTDIIMGTIYVLVVLEIARRTIGWPLVIIGLAFIIYCLIGPYLPGLLSHRGFHYDRIISQMYLTLEGINGIPLGVMVQYVYFFLVFAGFLEATGAGQWFIDIAYALTGRTRSGPALTAVVASGFLGSVSGSAVANTVASGTFTIPLMKRVGYKPEFAGAVEAAASTGGQIMPPIMGAGAFIIAEWTGIPYREIVIVSIMPAFLYFLNVCFFVHIRAIKVGIKRVPAAELPSIKKTFFKGIHFLISLFLLIYFLVKGYSPTYAVCIAIFSLIAVSFVRKESRLSISKVVNALNKASAMAIPVSAACAAAGIVVGSVGLTGLGLKFSSMVISAAGGFWLIAVLFVMLASLLLGMGLPVTAAYVVLAVLAAPGLRELGLTVLSAHLLILWYSQDSNVTPPVCLAAYAAAGIAGSNQMKTGVQSWGLAKGLYLIPLLFVFTDILSGSFLEVLYIGLFAAIGLLSFTVSLEGFIIRRINIFERAIFFLSGLSIFTMNTYFITCGLLVIVVLIIKQVILSKEVMST